MRILILCNALLLLPAAPVIADWSDYDYVEDRELTLAADGASGLMIEAGAGNLEVVGASRSGTIEVKATVMVNGAKDDEAREFIERNMLLALERDGDSVVLTSTFRDGWGSGKNGAIGLEVSMPEGLALRVDDGSGSILIEDTRGDVEVDDGSGSLAIRDAGNVYVDDGSGSIEISDALGDVRVSDGSGSITIRRVTGSVSVDDGSGSINVKDVQGDFSVIDDGSGSVNYSNVMGRVDIPED